MCGPDMFIRNTCPVPVIRSLFSSLRTKPDPSSSACLSGLDSTSNRSCDEASMVRWTVMLVSVLMSPPLLAPGGNSRFRQATARRRGTGPSSYDVVVRCYFTTLIVPSLVGAPLASEQSNGELGTGWPSWLLALKVNDLGMLTTSLPFFLGALKPPATPLALRTIGPLAGTVVFGMMTFLSGTALLPTLYLMLLAEPDSALICRMSRIGVTSDSGTTTVILTGRAATFLPFFTFAGRSSLIVTPMVWSPRAVAQV